MLNWKDPEKELPNQGDIVWVLYQHNKKHNPRSCQMMCGEFNWNNNKTSCRVESNDFTGNGWWSIYLKIEEESDSSYEMGIAWIDTKDFQIPIWVPHDKWWDGGDDA